MGSGTVTRARMTRAGETYGKPRAAWRDRESSLDVLECVSLRCARPRGRGGRTSGVNEPVYAGCYRLATVSASVRYHSSVCRRPSSNDTIGL